MSIGASDAVARVAAIQQMTSTLLGGPPPTGGVSFAGALQAAQSAQPVSQTTPAGGAVSGTPFAAEINAAAAKHGIDPALLAGLVKQESGFNPSATSSAGAKGLTQLMPATARSLGVTDATDPLQALDGGAKYLRQQLDRFGGDERLALAAYNAGPGAVQRFGGIPPYAETQAYVQKVLANRDAYAAASPASAAAVLGSTTSPIAGSSNLPLSTSSTSGGYGSSSPLSYPTT